MDGLDECGTPGVSRTMMPHFQDVGMDVNAFGQQPLSGLKSRITHKERAQCPVLKEHDQRVFIHIIRPSVNGGPHGDRNVNVISSTSQR
jgi:hypothetical protein